MKKVGKYKLKAPIGKGAFSVVHAAVDQTNGKEYAIKMCEKAKLSAKDMLGELENEIGVLKRIRSKYVANLADVIQTTRYYYLVLDLCKRTLFEAIVTSPEKRLSEPQSRTYFQELLLAVYSCHQQGVMHRDIKPENILLTEDNHVKLSDFGFACPVSKADDYRTQCGTRQYLAPEVFYLNETTEEFDGFACDAWSCGIVLFVMVCGKLPFADHNPDVLRQKISSSKYRTPEHVSPECSETIATILNPNASQRPTIFQILEMAWCQIDFETSLLDEINDELMRQRAIQIEPMPPQFNRHVPEVLTSASSPQFVESYSLSHGSCPVGGIPFPTSYSATSTPYSFNQFRPGSLDHYASSPTSLSHPTNNGTGFHPSMRPDTRERSSITSAIPMRSTQQNMHHHSYS
ncbi:CBL-interacting protein kinase 9 [Diplonema papillatum]|nr:CBL-interacting protein kinase 9 [Diplonema papillatum]